MPEDRYEVWAENGREGLRETYLSLIAELARIHEWCGEYVKAVQALREALAEDPTREEAHVGLMRLDLANTSANFGSTGGCTLSVRAFILPSLTREGDNCALL